MPNPRRSRPIRAVLAIACALALAGCAASPGAAPEPPELPLVPTEQAEFRTEDVQQAMHRLMDAGAPGLHFFTFNEHAAVLDVLDQLDLPRYSNRFSQPLSELEFA